MSEFFQMLGALVCLAIVIHSIVSPIVAQIRISELETKIKEFPDKLTKIMKEVIETEIAKIEVKNG